MEEPSDKKTFVLGERAMQRMCEINADALKTSVWDQANTIMTFGEQLEAERLRLKLTQAQIANILGVSAKTYWDWKKGNVLPLQITQKGALVTLREEPAPS